MFIVFCNNVINNVLGISQKYLFISELSEGSFFSVALQLVYVFRIRLTQTLPRDSWGD